LGLVDPTGQVFEIKTCPVGSTRPKNARVFLNGVRYFINIFINITPHSEKPVQLERNPKVQCIIISSNLNFQN